ncbi:2-dehydro-3-deoxyphosphooctonate aldolase [Flavobacterium sediminis]|uniref:2-dehydro-3-deoxyphosphooctonate aldolase n=1 Tax=Flavobacterium sediminis TaxID=2201181 RepID=A0A2U8QYC8_9FLAO|nr:DUF1801 domain-containing protein [Flavobacterium sediminis]AWM15173.1 2-dehydro-3-deoxyphosphooctonate aldolase [Flavobacterium sediminis]
MKVVDEYILRQPELYREMLLHVIAVIAHDLPEAELLFKWGIPYFYYKKKPFYYLAPNHKKKFLDVGFAKGFELKENQEFLIGEKRNTVKSLRYYALEEIDNQVLIAVIKEALTLYRT